MITDAQIYRWRMIAMRGRHGIRCGKRMRRLLFGKRP